MSARVIPRPSTAGRQRANGGGNGGSISTPRGTSSGNVEGIMDGTSYSSCVVSQTSCAPVARSDTATQTAFDEHHHKRLEALAAQKMASDESLLLLRRCAESLAENKQRSIPAVDAIIKSRDAAVHRCEALESEILELRSAMAKKNEDLQSVKRQLAHLETTGLSKPSNGGGAPSLCPLVIFRPRPEKPRSVATCDSVASSSAVTTPSGRVATAPVVEVLPLHTSHVHHQQHAHHLSQPTQVSAFEKMKQEWRERHAVEGIPAAGVDALMAVASVETLTVPTVATAVPVDAAAAAAGSSNLLRVGSYQSIAAANSVVQTQKEIISCLEKEIEHLRKQRDETVIHNQREHDKLMQELEETRETLGTKDASWHEKQKELNRLRTLMRFSQLKRDSDKLQETYARLDQLENRLRAMHTEQHRLCVDRDDLQRLRIIETQLIKIMRGELSWSAFPRELLSGGSAQRSVPQPTSNAPVSSVSTTSTGRGASVLVPPPPPLLQVGPGSAMQPARPSTAKAALTGGDAASGGAWLNRAGALPQPKLGGSSAGKRETTFDDGFIIKEDTDDTDSVDGDVAHSSGKHDMRKESRAITAAATAPADSAKSERGAEAVQKDEDVSFSTITDRMKAYLERRTRQQAEQEVQSQKKKAVAVPIQPVAVENGSSALSTYAKRLERLRRDSVLSGGSGSGNGSGGAPRPQSASRSSEVAPSSSLYATNTALVASRPTSASTAHRSTNVDNRFGGYSGLNNVNSFGAMGMGSRR